MLLLLSNFILLVSIGVTRSQSTHTNNTDLFQICLVARLSLKNLPRTLKFFFLKNKMNCVAVVNESRFSIYLMLFCCSYFFPQKRLSFKTFSYRLYCLFVFSTTSLFQIYLGTLVHISLKDIDKAEFPKYIKASKYFIFCMNFNLVLSLEALIHKK